MRQTGPCLRRSLNRATNGQDAQHDQDIETEFFHNVSGIKALGLILAFGGKAYAAFLLSGGALGRQRTNENLDLDSST